jgi:hypothetical protein
MSFKGMSGAIAAAIACIVVQGVVVQLKPEDLGLEEHSPPHVLRFGQEAVELQHPLFPRFYPVESNSVGRKLSIENRKHLARKLYGNVKIQFRLEITVAKLGLYKGRGNPASTVVYAVVSTIGVMGMFAAIVGAMLGVWLDDASADADDEDRYSYWDNGEWDIEGELGWEREYYYSGMREVGCLLYSS